MLHRNINYFPLYSIKYTSHQRHFYKLIVFVLYVMCLFYFISRVLSFLKKSTFQFALHVTNLFYWIDPEQVK
jgi:hypothetical protein